jgi:hypothetical protein
MSIIFEAGTSYQDKSLKESETGLDNIEEIEFKFCEGIRLRFSQNA